MSLMPTISPVLDAKIISIGRYYDSGTSQGVLYYDTSGDGISWDRTVTSIDADVGAPKSTTPPLRIGSTYYIPSRLNSTNYYTTTPNTFDSITTVPSTLDTTRLAYSSLGSTYVAQTTQVITGTQTIYTSTDLNTWTTRTSTPTYYLEGVLLSCGVYVGAASIDNLAGNNDRYRYSYSSDGVTWSDSSTFSGYNIQTFYSGTMIYDSTHDTVFMNATEHTTQYSAVASCTSTGTSQLAHTFTSNTIGISYFATNNLNKVVACRDDGSNNIRVSYYNWTSWNEVASVIDSSVASIQGVVWDGTQFVLRYTLSGAIDKVATSPDGITWTTHTTGLTSTGYESYHIIGQ